MSKLPSGTITTSTFIRFWLVMVGFLATLLMIYLMRGALLLIGISAFLAIALNPPVNAISRRLPGKSRVGAIALAYILVVILLGLFVVTVVPTVVEQFARFIKTLPGVIEDISRQTHWINDLIIRYDLQEQYSQSLDNFQTQASSVASHLGSSVISSVGSLLTIVASTILVLVMTFLMLVEGPAWTQRIWGLYKDPTKQTRHKSIARKMYHVVTGYVNGQVLISGISSICSLVVILVLSAIGIFDIPANLAIPIAVILFMAGLIPMFGATIGAIIAGLLLAVNDVGAAIVFLVYYFIYQQIENSFISPQVQSRSVEISALTVLIALTIGLSLFGILGGIISIPIAGCVRILVLDYLERNKSIAS